MTGFGLPLAQMATRTYYEATRLGALDQWWHWLLLAAVVLALLALTWGLYRRDGDELPRATRWALLVLRWAAFAGLLLFFFQIEKRTEQKLTKNSRAIVLVDTSQSMGLSDPGEESGVASEARRAGARMSGTRRIDRVLELLGGPLLESLTAQHDVVVYRFDEQERPSEIATLPRTTTVDAGGSPVDEERRRRAALGQARVMIAIAAGAAIAAILALLAHLVLGVWVRTSEGESWALLVSVVCLIVAGVFYSVSNLRHPEIGWQQVFLSRPIEPVAADTESPAPASDQAATTPDWPSLLTPRGNETRLGDALQYLIDQERGGPVAGITVFTDGNSNAGIDYRAAITSGQQAEVPVHLIGVGSDRRPANVRVVDIEAPQRIYPGDQFNVRGFIQAYGLSGRSAKVQLRSQRAEGPGAEESGSEAPAQFEEEQIINLPEDGEVTPVDFEVTPGELGRRTYLVRVETSGEDLDPRDNEKSTSVQVVDRKNRVLLLAGGPTREYRFVRDLCYRDQDVSLDVLLQGSLAGAAQEADQVLDELPSTPEAMFEYDCVVAFDPDWESIGDEQIELLDRWVAEKAGGLIVVAGPVYTPEWTTLRRDGRGTKTLKALYPVTFFGRAVMRLTRGTMEENPSVLRFSDAGRQGRFLWLDDTAARSEQIWSGFDGIYASYPVQGLKPAATLYAQLDRGSTGSEDNPAVFLAEQFYGAGRVVYLGSGELWRLRAISPSHFERLYTQLIRHASQGRLLRDSSRGLLMVGKERCVLGETIIVRASLTDAQFRPLQTDLVQADLISPTGIRQPLDLRRVPNAPRAGTYTGQFTALLEGDYRLELVIPESEELELLMREVRVRVPELEVEQPQRNDAIMSEMAQATGGKYFVAADSTAVAEELAATLVPQDQETYLPGTPDRRFQRRLMGWLMTLICGVLSLEWLIRRLNKLA